MCSIWQHVNKVDRVRKTKQEGKKKHMQVTIWDFFFFFFIARKKPCFSFSLDGSEGFNTTVSGPVLQIDSKVLSVSVRLE